MPNRISYLKARYCRAVLRSALQSRDDDARRLVYCLATEPPTAHTSPELKSAEAAALAAIARMATLAYERGASSIAVHWKDTDILIERWIAAAYQDGDE